MSFPTTNILQPVTRAKFKILGSDYLTKMAEEGVCLPLQVCLETWNGHMELLAQPSHQ